jgi:hypothetical protein
MKAIERGGYSREEVLGALHSKNNSRTVRFRYDLLDKNEYFLKTLKSVESGSIEMSALSTIKRTAKFKIKETIIPERYEREADKRQTVVWNTTSHWNAGTLTDLQVDGTDLIISTPATSALTGSDFEGSSWTGVHPTYTIWGGDRGNGAYSATGGWNGSKGQQLNRTGSGSLGIQTSGTLTLAVGDKVYLSFLFKPTGADFNTPNYCYILGTNQAFNVSNAVITSLGSGWYRYDNVLTNSTAGSYGVLIGWNTGTTGSVIIDNVYFQKNNAPLYAGEWVSNVKDISGNSATYISSLITSIESNKEQGDTILDTRLSFDDGKTWTAWSNDGSGTTINGLSGGDKLDYALVQVRGRFKRFHIDKNANRLKEINFWIDKEISVYKPETTEINYGSDRIQPYMELQMPDGNWIEFPLGIFLLNTPTRSDETGAIYREIEAYDGLIILDEDKFAERYYIAGGKRYTQAITEILTSAGIKKFNIQDSDKTIGSKGLEFATGTSKLEVVNQLLRALNYVPLWVDSIGYFTSYEYSSPTYRGVDYEYLDDSLSVLYNGIEEELDLNVPNSWVAVQSNPEKTPLVSRKVNNSVLSPTSTVNVGRTIVDFREVDDIADQPTLDNYVNRIAFEASQVFGKLKFSTALMPFHEYSDVLRVRYAPLGIDTTFVETSWKMDLEAGGVMEHEVRKVVEI